MPTQSCKSPCLWEVVNDISRSEEQRDSTDSDLRLSGSAIANLIEYLSALDFVHVIW